MREVTNTNPTHLEPLIAGAFIGRDNRRRFVSNAASRKFDASGQLSTGSRKKVAKYRQMLSSLEHWLDPRCKRLPISSATQHDCARQSFSTRGSESGVYVMSCDHTIDGTTMEVDEVLSYLTQKKPHGTLLVALNLSVAYFEQSELDDLTQLLLRVPQC